MTAEPPADPSRSAPAPSPRPGPAIPADRSVVVVVPTYNERDNLPALVADVLALGPSVRMVIVDDGSPDGTGALADELAATHPGRIDVLHRAGKQGLGTAYVAGFRHALADGAHPALVERTLVSDLVLGSRYVEGGGTAGWPLTRRLLSRFGGLYARTVLGLPLRDLTGGFKVYRRAALERLDLDGLRADGYGFQIETTWRVIRNGGRVSEVPILFHDRVAGASKLSRGIVREAALLVWQLRLDRLRERR